MGTLLNIVISDLKKVRKSIDIKSFLSALFFNAGFKRILLFRLLNKKTIFKPFILLFERHLKNKYLVYISKNAKIGSGFNLPHCFSIIISDCKIGNNVTILQQVTIGSSRGGRRGGTPIIGNNVFVGAGAKIIGNVTIGDDVMIGANAVVTKDIPSGAIVGGVPARVLSMEGKEQIKYWCSNMKDYNELVK